MIFEYVQSKSKWLTGSKSMVDARDVGFEFDFFSGNCGMTENPLKTTFDLADLFINQSSEKLPSSPFLDCWTQQIEYKYTKQEGIWLSSTNDSLLFIYEEGTRHIGANFADRALFFPIPSHGLSKLQNQLRLIITCMN